MGFEPLRAVFVYESQLYVPVSVHVVLWLVAVTRLRLTGSRFQKRSPKRRLAPVDMIQDSPEPSFKKRRLDAHISISLPHRDAEHSAAESTHHLALIPKSETVDRDIRRLPLRHLVASKQSVACHDFVSPSTTHGLKLMIKLRVPTHIRLARTMQKLAIVA